MLALFKTGSFHVDSGITQVQIYRTDPVSMLRLLQHQMKCMGPCTCWLVPHQMKSTWPTLCTCCNWYHTRRIYKIDLFYFCKSTRLPFCIIVETGTAPIHVYESGTLFMLKLVVHQHICMKLVPCSCWDWYNETGTLSAYVYTIGTLYMMRSVHLDWYKISICVHYWYTVHDETSTFRLVQDQYMCTWLVPCSWLDRYKISICVH